MTLHADAPVAVETPPGCPLCGSPRARDWVDGFDRLHRIDLTRFRYRICDECELVYLSPRPTAAAIATFYPDDYGPYQSTDGSAGGAADDPTRSWQRPPAWLRTVGLPLVERVNQLASLVLRERWRRRLKRFYQPSRSGLALLDFGCGSDRFLNKARQSGFTRTIGVDFTERVVASVRASGHEAHVAGESAWRAIAPGSVHVVRLNHVLEHLYEPRETIARLVERLAPEGSLHVALPNPASLTARVFGSRWFSLDCPRHIMLYTPARARRLLAEFGLRTVTVLHEPMTRDIARSVGYVDVDRGRLAPERVSALMHDRFLVALAWLPSRVAALIGRSDRFHLLARR